MFNKKSKLGTKIAVFMLITTLFLWLLPADNVLITGSGWLPGETVKLDFHETLIDLFQQTITCYSVAGSVDGSEGKINDIKYLIELRHLGASVVLTATGLTSGLTAQTTFTDHGTPTINWSDPADITVGTALGVTQLNATASVAGTFVYNPDSGTVLSLGDNQDLDVTFTPTDTANYNGNSKTVHIDVKALPGIVKTYSDGTFTTEKTTFAQGETVYFKAINLIPGTFYRFRLDSPSGTQFFVPGTSWTSATPGDTELT